MRAKATALDSLRGLRGVGPAMAEAMWELGFSRPEELRGADPQALYDRMAEGVEYLDRCVLYVIRCAVYQAEHDDPDPALCDWWRHKDREH